MPSTVIDPPSRRSQTMSQCTAESCLAEDRAHHALKLGVGVAEGCPVDRATQKGDAGAAPQESDLLAQLADVDQVSLVCLV